jgi:hypothetical protein
MQRAASVVGGFKRMLTTAVGAFLDTHDGRGGRVTFNGLLKVEFQGSRVTSEAGLPLVGELDERSVWRLSSRIT